MVSALSRVTLSGHAQRPSHGQIFFAMTAVEDLLAGVSSTDDLKTLFGDVKEMNYVLSDSHDKFERWKGDLEAIRTGENKVTIYH